ncbi:MAG: NrdH-redoxin [Rhodospirillaceae bacterium]|nr:NrdH-redoxin [Rhodospirillaceae bacterium]MBT5895368.1 NrdH-redoxin [Rhodospirillaceae bacterium]MBT6429218.1 NrdH-redoxin [Rhodospirillaceae bacterium]
MSARAVDFQSINVAGDPDGLAQLQALGVRTVPVVAKGNDYVMGLSLRDVGAFLGLDDQGADMLPPGELIQRLDWILSAAQRYLRQLPDDQMHAQLPGRPRSYRDLTYHLFQISRAFLGMASGEELTYEKLGESPGDELVTFADIADDGEKARQDLLAWWRDGGAERDFTVTVPTYYGPQPLHETLERTAWHTGQHVRQLMFILDGLNIAPDGPIGDRELSGLPLPEGVWDG